jgi:hypothetical protein
MPPTCPLPALDRLLASLAPEKNAIPAVSGAYENGASHLVVSRHVE